VNMIYLLVHFVVLRVIIQYHNMIPFSSLSLLNVVPHKIFTYVACIILAMILLL
jgi:hypothetical protein